MTKNYIIDTIEKLFRYFIPGFIFIFLFKLSFPSNQQFMLKNIGQVELYIYVLCIGMVIYGIHRVILFSILEPILYLMNLTAVSNFSSKKNLFKKLWEHPAARAEFLRIRHKNKKTDEKLSSYLFYRWSIQHYSLIFSELLFTAYFIHETDSLIECYKGPVIIVASVILLLSLLSTITMYRTEKELYKKKKRPFNKSFKKKAMKSRRER